MGRRAHVHGAIWAVVAAFLATTALFWAHTSHKSHLDPLLFIYAIYAVSTVSAAAGVQAVSSSSHTAAASWRSVQRRSPHSI